MGGLGVSVQIGAFVSKVKKCASLTKIGVAPGQKVRLALVDDLMMTCQFAGM
jgi:hypothetical protein